MLSTLFYFFLALFILITVHEYGHFLVARLCGVKVLRFSFGFGKVLVSWHDKKGTEYACSLIPLGGYVKMLDESEGEVPVEERALAFNNKPVWARIAIVIAGPLFNFIFAFIALWLVLMIGIHSLAPIIDAVVPGSVAAMAGLQGHEEIVSLNDKPIASWHDFQYALMPLVGSNEKLRIGVKSLGTGHQEIVQLSLPNGQETQPDLLKSLGVQPFIPKVPPVVGEVMQGSPAEQAGIQINDHIDQMDGKPLNDWLALVDYVKKNPNKVITLGIQRQSTHLTLTLTIGTTDNNGQSDGFLGVRSQQVDWPKQWLRFQHQTPLIAFATAFRQTSELTLATFTLIGRFISGKVALQNISGPVGIAQGAAQSARSGLAYYLSFLALISISLGVLNLLPIPMLDGGHLLYYVIELIRGRPLSEGVRTTGLYVGMVLLVALMLLAFSNDLSRL